jgi:hypothetical protein
VGQHVCAQFSRAKRVSSGAASLTIEFAA